MHKNTPLKIEYIKLKAKTSALVQKCNLMNPAEAEVLVTTLMTSFNKFIDKLMAEQNEKNASIVRVFFIEDDGRTGSPVYYVKWGTSYKKLIYSEKNTKLDDLNCLDAMRLDTYDVRRTNKEVLEYYGAISIYE